MKRIKVLQLQPDYNVKQHDFADLAEQIILAMPADKYETVSAFLSGTASEGQPESRAERSVYFDFSSRQLKGLRVRALWQLYSLCRAEQFDVIIANRFKPISMLLLLSRWLPRTGFIGIIHGFGDFERSYRRRQVQRLAGPNWKFVGVSPAVRQHLLDYQGGFTEANTIAITNAIDVDKALGLQLQRSEARRCLDLPAEATLVGVVGRLVPVKGHDLLLKAFAALKDRYPDTHLVIIGEGRERPRLEKLAAELDLTGRVHLPGFVPDALQYVRAFDIWAMPSLSEGLGLALLEGMCGALPVIASDVPAMKPLIEGAGGLAVKPGDVDSLQQALETYLALSADERRAKGEAAFAYVRASHSIIDYRQSYERLVEVISQFSSVS